jgi:hypothetical protein
MLDNEGYMHTHARVRTLHARTHTHRQIHNTYCFSTATMIRERTSVLRYTYTVCLVLLYHKFYSISENRRMSFFFLSVSKSMYQKHKNEYVFVTVCFTHQKPFTLQGANIIVNLLFRCRSVSTENNITLCTLG